MRRTNALQSYLESVTKRYNEGDEIQVEWDNQPYVIYDENDSPIIHVSPNVKEWLGKDISDAQEFRCILDDLNHEVEHPRRTPQGAKEEFIKMYPECPAVAGRIWNIYEDVYIDSKRTDKWKGLRKARAYAIDKMMENGHRRGRVDNIDSKSEAVVEGILQVTHSGYVKGADGVNQDLLDLFGWCRMKAKDIQEIGGVDEESNIADESIDGDGYYDERLEIFHDIMSEVLDFLDIDDWKDADEYAMDMDAPSGTVPDQQDIEEMDFDANSRPTAEAEDSEQDVSGESTDSDDKDGDSAGESSDETEDSSGDKSDAATDDEGEADVGQNTDASEDEDGTESSTGDEGGSDNSDENQDGGELQQEGEESDGDVEPTLDDFLDESDSLSAEMFDTDAEEIDADSPDSDEGDGSEEEGGDSDETGPTSDLFDDSMSDSLSGGSDIDSDEREHVDKNIEEMIDMDEDRSSGTWYNVPEGSDYEEVDSRFKERYMEVKKKTAQSNTHTAEKIRKRDELIDDNTTEVKERLRESGLDREIQEAFEELVTRDEWVPARRGQRLHKRNAIRHVSGDPTIKDVYEHKRRAEIGDRAVAVTLDMSQSISSFEIEAKMALAALHKATDIIGDQFTACGFKTFVPKESSAEVVTTPLITAPDEKFEWSHLNAIWPGGRTPTSSGIDEARKLLNECSKREEVLIVITDGDPNITLDGEGSKNKSIAESAAMVKDLQSEGIKVIGIGVGDISEENLNKIFHGNYVTTDMDNLTEKLVEIYRDQMHIQPRV